jgi:hypothetical protein
MNKWLNRSTLTQQELQSAAMDCLDFVASIQEENGQIGVRYQRRGRWKQWLPVNIEIPGLTTHLT